MDARVNAALPASPAAGVFAASPGDRDRAFPKGNAELAARHGAFDFADREWRATMFGSSEDVVACDHYRGYSRYLFDGER